MSTPSTMDEMCVILIFRKKRHARQICSMYNPTTGGYKDMSNIGQIKVCARRTEIGHSHREIESASFALVRLVEDLCKD